MKNRLKSLLKQLTNWRAWVVFVILYFFTGGWFLFVLGWILHSNELYAAGGAYVALVGLGNPFIPMIPLTIGLTLAIVKKK